ncbi:MAG TPA: dienelactone hydrolase family protein [Gemmatimonadaceae bacterium]|nr:dienelactone hydrolase family protein [Gemmatimonadaceae bacterium]
MRVQSEAIRLGLVIALTATACTSNKMVPATDSHTDHSTPSPSTTVVNVPNDPRLPADASGALVRLSTSSRHGEWVVVHTGDRDSLRAWVVYPERSTKAPVVIVVHEIFGLSSWIRGVADQLAADGFIAIAPDLLTMKNLPDGPDSVVAPLATAAIRTLDPAWVQKQLDAVGQYGMSLPAAEPRYGIVGFCWGGGVSFAQAVHSPGLGASVVYYGVSPKTSDLASVRAPVLGLYGGNDARVDATIPPADSALRALGRTYTYSIYPGAGHGFLRQQAGMDGANLAATRAAWPATIAWFRKYLGS